MAQLGILMPSTHNMANNLQSMETHPCYPLLDSSDTRYAQATQTWRHNTHTKKTKKKSLQFIKLEKSWDRSWFFKKLLCTYTIMSEYMCVCTFVCARPNPTANLQRCQNHFWESVHSSRHCLNSRDWTQVAGVSSHLPSLLSIPHLPVLFLAINAW